MPQKNPPMAHPQLKLENAWELAKSLSDGQSPKYFKFENVQAEEEELHHPIKLKASGIIKKIHYANMKLFTEIKGELHNDIISVQSITSGRAYFDGSKNTFTFNKDLPVIFPALIKDNIIHINISLQFSVTVAVFEDFTMHFYLQRLEQCLEIECRIPHVGHEFGDSLWSPLGIHLESATIIIRCANKEYPIAILPNQQMFMNRFQDRELRYTWSSELLIRALKLDILSPLPSEEDFRANLLPEVSCDPISNHLMWNSFMTSLFPEKVNLPAPQILPAAINSSRKPLTLTLEAFEGLKSFSLEFSRHNQPGYKGTTLPVKKKIPWMRNVLKCEVNERALKDEIDAKLLHYIAYFGYHRGLPPEPHIHELKLPKEERQQKAREVLNLYLCTLYP